MQETPRLQWPVPEWTAEWQLWQQKFTDLVNSQDSDVFGAIEGMKTIYSQIPNARVFDDAGTPKLEITSPVIVVSRTNNVPVSIELSSPLTLLPNYFIGATITPGAVEAHSSEFELFSSVPTDPSVQIFGYVTDAFTINWYNGATLALGDPFRPVFSFLSGSGTDTEKVKVTGADTTAGYLDDKLTAGAGIVLNVLNPGGNELVEIVSESSWARTAGSPGYLAPVVSTDTIRVGAGTEAQPGVSSWIDPDTGLVWPGSGAIVFSLEGSNQLQIAKDGSEIVFGFVDPQDSEFKWRFDYVRSSGSAPVYMEFNVDPGPTGYGAYYEVNVDSNTTTGPAEVGIYATGGRPKIEIEARSTEGQNVYFDILGQTSSSSSIVIQSSSTGASAGSVRISGRSTSGDGHVLIDAHGVTEAYISVGDGQTDEIRFDDSNLDSASISWVESYVLLSELPSEWEDYDSNFGEASIIDAINQTYSAAAVNYWNRTTGTPNFVHPVTVADHVRVGDTSGGDYVGLNHDGTDGEIYVGTSGGDIIIRTADALGGAVSEQLRIAGFDGEHRIDFSNAGGSGRIFSNVSGYAKLDMYCNSSGTGNSDIVLHANTDSGDSKIFIHSSSNTGDAYVDIGDNNVDYLRFADVNRQGSTWTAQYVVLSDSTSDWDTYEANFGEVSLFSAINSAYDSAGAAAAGQILFGTGTATTSEAELYYNTATNMLSLGQGAAPGATLHVASNVDSAKLDMYNSSNTTPATLYLRKSANSSIGTNQAVANNEDIGTIYFSGANGLSFNNTAYIRCVAAESFSSTDGGARLEVWTTPIDSVTSAQALNITQDQDLYVAESIVAGDTLGHTISGTLHDSIIFGDNVLVDTGQTAYASIVGGNNPTINGSVNSCLIVGDNQTVNVGAAGLIGCASFGIGNVFTGASNSSLMVGLYNEMSHDRAFVKGSYAKSEWDYGSFSASTRLDGSTTGSSQLIESMVLALRSTTTGMKVMPVAGSGSTSPLTIETGYLYTFTCRLTASYESSLGLEEWIWYVRAWRNATNDVSVDSTLLSDWDGSTANIGTGSAAWVANDTDDTIELQVTPYDASAAIQWVAHIYGGVKVKSGYDSPT